jgi:hypothetical protein
VGVQDGRDADLETDAATKRIGPIRKVAWPERWAETVSVAVAHYLVSFVGTFDTRL